MKWLIASWLVVLVLMIALAVSLVVNVDLADMYNEERSKYMFMRLTLNQYDSERYSKEIGEGVLSLRDCEDIYRKARGL